MVIFSDWLPQYSSCHLVLSRSLSDSNGSLVAAYPTPMLRKIELDDLLKSHKVTEHSISYVL